jgi:CxxC motif-containing protein (DUF1111 family)
VPFGHLLAAVVRAIALEALSSTRRDPTRRDSPYSDFLLHDMGRLGDGIAQSGAGTREMRTAPLWSVRFATTLLHDGRATTLSAAILAHDGQGRTARDAFAGLGKEQQAHLIAFLNSL